jgi:hypothetical protein
VYDALTTASVMTDHYSWSFRQHIPCDGPRPRFEVATFKLRGLN